jgi:hypothetical protein
MISGNRARTNRSRRIHVLVETSHNPIQRTWTVVLDLHGLAIRDRTGVDVESRVDGVVRLELPVCSAWRTGRITRACFEGATEGVRQRDIPPHSAFGQYLG